MLPSFSKKYFLFTFLTWGILLFAINGICGLIVRNTYIAVDPISTKTSSTTSGYFQPNQDKVILFPGIPAYHVGINAMGFRTVGINDKAQLNNFQNAYRILCLGDSTTFGLFANDEDSYPYRLQQKFISEKKNAVVFNAGVGGQTIPDYLYYLNLKGLSLDPDLVVINFCDNDLAELKDWKKPVYQKLMDENIFSLAKTIKLANFMRVFRKFELDYRYRRSTNKIKDPKVREILFKQSQALDDIFYLTKDQKNIVLNDPRSLDIQPLWDKYFQILQETIDLLKDRGIKYIVVIYPHIQTVFDKGKGNYQDILRKYMDEHSIPYIDLRPSFQTYKDRILSLYNNLPRDFHLSGAGNQIWADELYRMVQGQIN